MPSRPRLHACPLLAEGEKSSGRLRRVENCEKLVPKTSEKIENENAAAPTESVLEEASGWICSIQRLQEPALPEAAPGSPDSYSDELFLTSDQVREQEIRKAYKNSIRSSNSSGGVASSSNA